MSSPTTLADLAGQLAEDLAGLERELGEVDLLVAQARTEASRHEDRRAAAAAKLAAATGSGATEPKVLADLNVALITLTKRAALMESQVDVLEGKRRALARYRDSVADYVAAVGAVEPGTILAGSGPSAAVAPVAVAPGADGSGGVPMSRIVLTAQEDLRREIARAMHDGPAQSLTNIVLQAQILERLVEREPTSALGEVRQLVAMVQQTLDATKSFIFDVRPMVLDDLGLVPTLRRAARERGRRAGIPVEFETLGPDRRLPMDLESGLFRVLDEALAAYLGPGPDRVALRLDWSDHLTARVIATRDGAASGAGSRTATDGASRDDADLPPALAAMIEDRRADERDAAEAARKDALVVLPASVWRDISSRAITIGLTVELVEEGSELLVRADLPVLDAAATDSPGS
jgi:two-component system sensor histidine kinase DegS